MMWLVIASGVLDMAANFFYLEASHRGLLSIVAVISSMYPVSTVCLAFVLDHERVSKSQAVGLACAATASGARFARELTIRRPISDSRAAAMKMPLLIRLGSALRRST